jgi:hypothetical protein
MREELRVLHMRDVIGFYIYLFPLVRGPTDVMYSYTEYVCLA